MNQQEGQRATCFSIYMKEYYAKIPRCQLRKWIRPCSREWNNLEEADQMIYRLKAAEQNPFVGLPQEDSENKVNRGAPGNQNDIPKKNP